MNTPQNGFPGFPGFPPQPQQPAPQGPPGYQPQPAPQGPPGYQPQPAPQGFPPQGLPPQQQPLWGQPQPQQGWGQPQQRAPMGDWAGMIGSAEIGNRSGQNFIGFDGHAVADLDCLKVIDSIEHGPMLIAEFVIVEASMVEAKTGYTASLPAGDKRSWSAKLQTRPGAADALEFHHHLLKWKLAEQFDPRAVTREVLMYCSSEAQPFRGVRFHIKTWTAPQKKDKSKDFTHHEFRVLGLASDGARLNLTPSAPQAPAYASVPSSAPPISLPPMPPPGTPPTVPGSAMYMPGSPQPGGMPAAPGPAPQPMPSAPMPGWPAGTAWPGGGQR